VVTLLHFWPSHLRPAANIAAAMMATAMAGLGSVGNALAAQHGAPSRHAAPVFRASPVQYSPAHPGHTARPVQIAPAFPQQQQHNFQTAPEMRQVNPGLPLNNPSALRPNLPISNPSALPPNVPVAAPGGQAPNLPSSNAGALGPAAPPGKLGQQGASPLPSAEALKSDSGQPPVSQPAVVRPLLKPPPGGFAQPKPAFAAVQQRDKFWPLYRDRFMWVHGQRRHFVPVALLGAILIGDSYWYPNGYVAMDGPACTGTTADGCQLEWRMVDLEDGGAEPQCVQYCPQAGPSPAEAATAPPSPPPVAAGATCQTTIYAEPNFGGNSAPTGDSQPALSPTGWRNEIASIVVRAGIWDFFADENFGGESLRLGPGTYPRLAPEWTRHIGSFMCVEPGPPPA
jgi:Beta/Gamma crystallin